VPRISDFMMSAATPKVSAANTKPTLVSAAE